MNNDTEFTLRTMLANDGRSVISHDLSRDARDHLYVASLLRDIGELGIDRKVLDTPGALSADQREIVRRHPILGETILASLAFLGEAPRIVRAHHPAGPRSARPRRSGCSSKHAARRSIRRRSTSSSP
jgi:hypothetical protein